MSIPSGAAACSRLARHWSLVVTALLLLALCAALATNLTGGSSTSSPGARSHRLSRQGLLSLPLAAQGPVSTALGADGQVYRVGRWGAGLRASSPAQHLSASFARSGVSVRSGTTHVRFSLLGVGYGSALAPLGRVAPSAQANRVLYRRAGLSEWYANGPLGLEQGFTISRAPSGHPAGPLTLSIALSGNVRASLAPGGQSLTLSRNGKTVLRYTELTATDAHGHVLRSWLELRAGRLLLRVDARGALFPLRIDPFIQQGEKLTASGGTGLGSFGRSVALSSDGNTALIGAPEDNGGVGAAWVFARSGSSWAQQGEKLTGSGEYDAGQFGESVALSSDGNTALIGAPRDVYRGGAWVFTRSGSQWSQQGPELVGGTTQDCVGESVALSGDGNTAILGDPCNLTPGSAWVFTRSGATWTKQAELVGPYNAQDGWASSFGRSVALSSDGSTALIGGIRDHEPELHSAWVTSAWVFTRSGETWTLQGEPLVGSGDVFGYGDSFASVALSSDGDTALIGNAAANKGVGVVWAFTRNGSTWSQQDVLTGSGGNEATAFGTSVALSPDGNTALVGGDASGGTGAAWLFARSGGVWTQHGEALAGAGEIGAGGFGVSVALSSYGNTALVGGSNDNSDAGAAWVFTNTSGGGGGGGGSGVPVNTGAPTISGTAAVGYMLSCSPGSWSGDAPIAYGYAWIRGRVVVSGLGSLPSYTVTAADQGHQLQCEVTATNAVGSGTALSAAVGVPSEQPPCPVGSPPRAVVILITGIASELPQTSSYDPLNDPYYPGLRRSYCGLATASASSNDLADLAFMAQHSFEHQHNSGTPIRPVDFTDALAETGAVLLPFSYDGVSLTGTPGAPLYQVGQFGDETPGSVSPASEADAYLLQLVQQAHHLWRTTRIFVIGHSEGGLVAEQLFERHSLNELQGVARIVSLDSPLNGVAHDLGWFGTGSHIVEALHIGPALFDFWTKRWNERESLDHRLILRDERMGEIYMPVGSEGDPVYAFGNLGPFRSSCPSLESQLLWVLTPCEANGKVALLESPPSRVTPEPATGGTPHWPAEGVSGVLERFFASHEFVMQSPDNISYLAGVVAGRAKASSAAIRTPVASLTQPIASLAAANAAVGYTPAITARLERPTARAGGTIAIDGTGFGAATGTAEIAAGGVDVPLAPLGWTPNRVTLRLPTRATSGPVVLTTAVGNTTIAGIVGVTHEAYNHVASLRHVRGGAIGVNGEAAAIEIRAIDSHRHPLRNTTVEAVNGSETRRAVTNAHGIAILRLVGYGCQPVIAFSGATSIQFRVCWRRAPRQTLALTAHHRRSSTTIVASIRAHGPVHGESVNFQLAAGGCAHINRRRVITNKRGVATVTLVNHCRMPVMIEASTNHNTLTRSILANP